MGLIRVVGWRARNAQVDVARAGRIDLGVEVAGRLVDGFDFSTVGPLP